MNKDNNMRLSKHFTLAEFTKSDTADRLGIDNTIPEDWFDEIVTNLIALCEDVYEPVREEHGAMVITSGYRCKELNSTVGGSVNSNHITGNAGDSKVVGVSNYKVWKWMRDNGILVHQCFLENHDPEVDINSGWIHTSYFSPFMSGSRVNLEYYGKLMV